MIGLLRSEIRRLTSRRIARAVALIILAIVLLTIGRVFMVSSKDAGPQLAQAEFQANLDRQRCEAGTEEWRGFPCDQITASGYFDDPRLYGKQALPDGTKAVAIGIAIFAVAVGASYVGADWNAGTMQALLFWEPRRGRVLLAKGVALVTVCLAFLVAVETVTYLGLWFVSSTRGTTEGVTAGLHMANLLAMLRGALVVSIAALFGFGVAGLARHSGAAMGVGFVYFVVLENLMRGLRPGWQRWLIAENFSAVMSKQTAVVRAHAKSIFTEEGIGRPYILTGVRGAVTLGIYLAILLGAFYLAFTRRDVT